MQSLSQALRRNAASGEPIHSPVKAFNDNGVHMRKGQLSMIVAGPGSGKSYLIQAILHNGDRGKAKNSCLYFSADTGPDVIYKRAACLATGYTATAVEDMMANGNTESIETAIQQTESHITWNFTPNPSEQYVIDELKAYEGTYGHFPEVIVMDNLKDLYIEGMEADEFRSLEEACVFLKNLAKLTGSAVIALHHAGGAFEDGTATIPLSGARGKVSKTPAVILTIARQGEDMRVSVVKNRNGKADQSGKLWYPIRANLERGLFEG